MRTLLKIIAWVSGAAVVLFGVAGLALYFLLPRDKIIAWLVPQAEAALGRRVSVADAGVDFWPPFGLYVQGLQIANRAGFDPPIFFAAGVVRADLAWAPLFTGRIVLRQVALENLVCHYEVADDSTSNISDILTAESEPLRLLMERFRLRNLAFHYRDRRDGTLLLVDSLQIDAALDVRRSGFAVDLHLPRWQWQDSAETYHGTDPVVIRLAGSYRSDPQEVDCTEISGSLSGLPFAGSGRVLHPGADALVDLQMQLGPIEWSDLVKRLPAARRRQIEPHRLGGSIAGDFRLKGALADGAAMELRGELVWLKGSVQRDGATLARFASLAVPLDEQGLHIRAADLLLFEGPAQLAAVLSPWPPEKVEFTLSGNLDLAKLPAAYAPAPLAGELKYAFSGAGPLTEPASWSVKVRLNPEQAALRPDERAAFTVASGTVEYDGRVLELRQLRIEAGPTRATLAGRAAGLEWARLLADSPAPTPHLGLDLRSDFADLDRFFPALAPEGARPAQAAAMPPAPPLTADVTLRADTLILGGARWSSVRGRLRYRDGVLSIDTLHGQVYEGSAALRGSIALGGGLPTYDLTVAVDSVQCGALLSRFTPFARHLRGRSSMTARIDGRGTEWGDLVEQLSIEGSALLFDTRLVDLEAASAVAGLVGLQPGAEVTLRSLQNSFKVEKGRLRFDDFAFQALDGDWNLTGDAGFDGSLDYRLDLLLSPAQSGQLKLPADWAAQLSLPGLADLDPVSLLKDDRGRAQLFLRLGGTHQRPNVAFDWDRLQPVIQQRFKSRVADRLQKDVAEKAKTGLREALEKLKKP